MRHQRPEEYLSGNLTAMIDVVFQLIIFFVATVNMQKPDERIKLAEAPHGRQTVTQDRDEIKVEVDKNGVISIARMQLSRATLTQIFVKAMADSGRKDLPILIRADAAAKHKAVKEVMDACTDAKLYRVRFVAIKEKAG